jgi:hypothetical protein
LWPGESSTTKAERPDDKHHRGRGTWEAACWNRQTDGYAWYTVRPPTTVLMTFKSFIVSGATACGSLSRITKSANFPAVIEPLIDSSCEL